VAVGRRIAAGDVVAGYEVGALVGRGGMGEVFRARDVRLERPVALKLLAERLSDDEGFRDRMLRESRLAASLDHPNVVPIYEAGDADGRLFIAMRFVEGIDLRALLRREGPLDAARTIAIATQVADALDAAHAKGLVHRDVKPSNVLLDHQGGREHVYLADFGLTQSASDTGPTDGQLMGTVDYVAPEQIRGDRLDGRADVYALGCLLFEALTGTLPFTGASDVAVVFAHLQDEPPRASERRPGLPSDLDAVLARAMAKDPDERPDTCRALVEEARVALGLGQSRRGVRALVLAALGALVVASVAAAAGVVLLGSGTAEAEPGGAIVEIDPRSGELVGSVPVVAAPTHIASTSGQVWFATTDTLWRLNPAVGRPVRVEAVGYVHDLAGVDRTMYVARDGEKLLEGIVVPYDAVDGTRADGVSLRAGSLSASEDLGIWAAGCPDVQRLRVEPNRITVDRTVTIPFLQPTTAGTVRNCLCSMTTGAGSVWVVGDAADPRVFRITPGGELSAAIQLPFAPRAIAFAGDAVWVSGPLDDVVMRIDPDTNRVVDRLSVAGGPAGMTAGPGGLWVALNVAGTLARIDTGSGRVAGHVDVPGHPFEIAATDDRLWVTTDEG
jgi:Protein kinase domain